MHLKTVAAFTSLLLPQLLAAQLTPVKFFKPEQFLVGGQPGLMAKGDFNGDGVEDLAVPCPGSNSFSILLGNRHGGFTDQMVVHTSRPTSIAVGDVNGDGIEDLVVNGPTAAITIYFGKGDGTFPASRALPFYGQEVELADFNNDGMLDIALAGELSITILPGNGDGTFQQPRTTTLQKYVVFFTAGDFNGDGRKDLALVEMGTGASAASFVTVAFGNGDGTFRQGSKLFSGQRGTGLLVTGDFNGDGRSDIAGISVGAANWSLVTILGQNGGTFSAPPTYPLQDGAFTVASADVTGDGILDLAVANGKSGTVTVLQGKGDGTFGRGLSYPAALDPYSIALGNFAGDSRAAIAVDSINYGAATQPSSVSLLLNAGDGQFLAPVLRVAKDTQFVTVPGDFNRDGNLDLLGRSPSGLAFLAGNGNGTFQPEKLVVAEAGGIAPIAAADFNNDGILDVLAFGTDSNIGTVYLGNGDGSLRLPANKVQIPGASGLAVGDVNGDGNPDIVDAIGPFEFTKDITVYLGNGDGTFQTGILLPYLGLGGTIELGDFNSDGKLDMITASDTIKVGALLLGNGDGTFQAPRPASPAAGGVAIDFNRDGKLDLVTPYAPTGGVIIALGNGDGTFQPPVVYPASPGIVNAYPFVADFNGDGKLDIALAVEGRTYFYLGNGDGTFQTQATRFLFGPNGFRTFGDFFNHGKPDVQTSFGSDGTILILKNETP